MKRSSARRSMRCYMRVSIVIETRTLHAWQDQGIWVVFCLIRLSAKLKMTTMSVVQRVARDCHARCQRYPNILSGHKRQMCLLYCAYSGRLSYYYAPMPCWFRVAGYVPSACVARYGAGTPRFGRERRGHDRRCVFHARSLLRLQTTGGT